MKTLKTLICGTYFIFSFSASAQYPSNWPNKYVSNDGTIWSNVLPGKYANCISEVDAQPSDGFTVCKAIRNSAGEVERFLNASNELGVDIYKAGLKIVEKSDASEACRVIGGKLPTRQNYINLGSEFVKLPGMQLPGIHENYFWTSSYTPNEINDPWSGVFEFIAMNGNTFPGTSSGVTDSDPWRNQLLSVRCVDRQE